MTRDQFVSLYKENFINLASKQYGQMQRWAAGEPLLPPPARPAPHLPVFQFSYPFTSGLCDSLDVLCICAACCEGSLSAVRWSFEESSSIFFLRDAAGGRSQTRNSRSDWPRRFTAVTPCRPGRRRELRDGDGCGGSRAAGRAQSPPGRAAGARRGLGAQVNFLHFWMNISIFGLLEADSKSLCSVNGARRASASSPGPSSLALSQLGPLEEETWSLWGRIVSNWDEWRKKKEKLLKQVLHFSPEAPSLHLHRCRRRRWYR
ncbi:uncharacterized protein [Taeniopygia guttata]|uniref:uncharacterized protein isoform X10 n=1 Tax=Taeniopygia guttata TaxID=59729 RepID=UPI003BB917B7